MKNTAPRRGAYARRGKKRTRPSVVAFIDFLGFADTIKQAAARDEEDDLLNNVLTFVRSWRGSLVDRFSYSGQRSWEVKLFTDNIVIGHPLRRDSDSEMGGLIGQLGLFQIGAVSAGFFIRGGISVGRFYMDSDVVFGVPLLDAYYAESKLAVMPRVIFTGAARSFIAKRAGPKKYMRDSPYYRDILQDEDGQLFLNYLDACYQTTGEPPEVGWVEEHRDAVQVSLRKFRKNPHVRAKYEWVARYHNFWCGGEHLPEFAITGFSPLSVRRLDEVDDLEAA